MRWLETVTLGLTLLVLSGCSEPPTDPHVLASFRGGEVTLTEVERTLQQTLHGVSDRDELAQAYRDLAEAITVERVILAEIDDREAEIETLGEAYRELRRNAALDLYRSDQLGIIKPATTDEVEAFYREHRDQFHRQHRSLVWHIFLRFEDHGGVDSTLAELEALRHRATAGESFVSLAREHSDSETRLSGGRLGWIGKNRLPPTVEKVVLALNKGEISEPVPLTGGASIFMVSEVLEENQMSLEDVKGLIVEHLNRQSKRQKTAEIVGDLQPPPESIVLAGDEILRTLRSAPPEQVILDIEGSSITVSDLLEIADEIISPVPGLPFTDADLVQLYEDLVHDHLLYLQALEDGFLERPEVRSRLEASLERGTNALLIERQIERAMEEKVDREQKELRRFYETNRFLFQSHLRFKLQSLSVPLRQSDPGQPAHLESLQKELAAGSIDLNEAAQRSGGGIVDMGWLAVTDLLRLDPKVRTYVLDAGGPGYTIPFQLNHRLHIIWIEQREEPEVLPFEEVSDQVRREYLARHQQRIYEQLRTEILVRADFHLFEETLQRALDPPS